MSYLTLDLSETGLKMFFRPYQIAALYILWNNNEHLSSREVWIKVNQVLQGTISRASIINFLNASVENGLLDFMVTTGKGCYMRLYTPKRSKDETSKYLSKIVQDQLQTL